MQLAGDIAALLAPATACRPLELTPCPVSGNNRVFFVTAGAQQFVAKQYFAHPSDSRDRLSAEWDFLTYARNIGVTCVPRPLFRDVSKRLAIFDFIPGRKLVSGEIDADCVEMAGRFIRDINEPGARTACGSHLANASEACFSVAQHVAVVDRRMDRLQGLEPEDQTQAFATTLRSLAATWHSIRDSVMGQVDDVQAAIADGERCISPSDFGFHNALIDDEGHLVFIDFEYAGWDDPAKLVGDFFAQPAVPVPVEFASRFVEFASAHTPSSGLDISRRSALLRPVYQVKWCCIMLNEFLPDAAQRRQFADPGFDHDKKKRDQLAKVSQALRALTGRS